MGTLKNGGKSGLGLDSTALQRPKPGTSLTLQKAKQFAIESKGRIAKHATSGQFIVSIGKPTGGSARMLSKSEVEQLRKTKHSVAKHAMESFKGR